MSTSSAWPTLGQMRHYRQALEQALTVGTRDALGAALHPWADAIIPDRLALHELQRWALWFLDLADAAPLVATMCATGCGKNASLVVDGSNYCADCALPLIDAFTTP